MEIKLKTLTPLWTGGVDGKVDRIHETGILGSLRWWHEVLVRGLGGSACDPSRHECTFDAKKYHKSKANDEQQRLRDAGLCDVCQVFGATGWQRRFRMEVVDNSLSDDPIQHEIKADRNYTNSRGNTRIPIWYFRDPTQSSPKPNTPKSGEFIVRVQSLFPNFSLEIVAGLLQFVSNWAALGARPQMGFGVVDLEEGRVDTKPFYDWITAVGGGQPSRGLPSLPSLQNMFFARIIPKDNTSFPEEETFNLKYDLRRLFANDEGLRHFIMGTVSGRRMAAKIKMSRPYEHEGKSNIRVWGWIPREAKECQNNWDRQKVVEKIYKHLQDNYCLEVWREAGSDRDTVTPNNNDAKVFLKSLLRPEEENNAI